MKISLWNRFHLLIAALECTKFPAAVGGSEQCVYKGNMCNIPHHCFKDIRLCKGILYPHLAKSRDTVAFSITIDEESLHNYASNTSFTIVSEINRHKTTVPECCGLSMNKSCNLRPKKEGEKFWIFAPLDEGGYCDQDIQEYSLLTWCYRDNSTYCIQMTSDGTIIMRNEKAPMSIDSQTFRAKYYFFKAPKSYAEKGERKMGYYTLDVSNITMYQTDPKKIFVGGEEVEYNETGYVDLNQNAFIAALGPAGCEVWCFFLQVEEKPTYPTASCYNPQTDRPDSACTADFNPVPLLAAIGAVMLVLILIGILLALPRIKARIKYCLPNSKEAETSIHPDTKRVILNQDEEANHFSTKEIPDQMSFTKVPEEGKEDDRMNIYVIKASDAERNPGDNNNLALSEVSGTDEREGGLLMRHSGCTDDTNDVFTIDEDRLTSIDGYSKKEATASHAEGRLEDSGFGTNTGSGLSSVRSIGSDYQAEYESNQDSNFFFSPGSGTHDLKNKSSIIYTDVISDTGYTAKGVTPTVPEQCLSEKNCLNQKITEEKISNKTDKSSQDLNFYNNRNNTSSRVRPLAPSMIKTDVSNSELSFQVLSDTIDRDQRDSNSSADTGFETSGCGDGSRQSSTSGEYQNNKCQARLPSLSGYMQKNDLCDDRPSVGFRNNADSVTMTDGYMPKFSA